MISGLLLRGLLKMTKCENCGAIHPTEEEIEMRFCNKQCLIEFLNEVVDEGIEKWVNENWR